MKFIEDALAQYGASLRDACIISSRGATQVCVRVKRGRLRFESSTTGALLATGAPTEQAVCNFVESFWFWRKINAQTLI